MNAPETIAYHLAELEIARNKNHPSRCMPLIEPHERVVVDIGCGIGQFFLASNMAGKIAIGIDNDPVAIDYGIRNYGREIHFILSDARKIPLPSGIADLVVSRVALPYTNIPRVIKEIKRILSPTGRLWLTIHPKQMIYQRLRSAFRRASLKEVAQVEYTLLNGWLFKTTGKVLPFLTGQYESWQDVDRMLALLRDHSFSASYGIVGHSHVIEGKLAQPPGPASGLRDTTPRSR